MHSGLCGSLVCHSFPPPPLLPLFHCLRSVTGVRVTVHGAHGWVVGIGSHRSNYYCPGAGWSQCRPLGFPKHTSSTQLDAVVKVTVYLQGWLHFNGCSASRLHHRYPKPYIKLKLIELGIQIFHCFFKKINS